MSTVWSAFGLDDPKDTCDRVLLADPVTLNDRCEMYVKAHQELVAIAHEQETALETLHSWEGTAADACRDHLNYHIQQRFEQATQCFDASNSFRRVQAAMREAQHDLSFIRGLAEEVESIYHHVLNALDTFVNSTGEFIHGIAEEAHGFLVKIPLVGSAIEGMDHIMNRVVDSVGQALIKIPGSRQVESFLDSLQNSQHKLRSLSDFVEPLRAHAIALNTAANLKLYFYEKVLRAEAKVLTDLQGIVDLTAGPDDRPGDAELRRGSLFYAVYHHFPLTEQDRLMADALDPNGSDTTDSEPESHVVVIRIKPVPGAGVLHGDAYIPQAEVMNPLSGTDGLNPIPFNKGDNREDNATAAPDKSRMSWYIDYEQGVVVCRQNVTSDLVGHSASGNPHVGAEQDSQGRVRLRVEGFDALANPAGVAMHGSVKMDVIVDPRGGVERAQVNGRVSQYPSFEMYQFRDGHHERIMHSKADTEPLGIPEKWGLGPAIGLTLYNNIPTGDNPQVLQEWYDHYHPAQAHPGPDEGIVLAPDPEFQRHTLPDARYPTFQNGQLSVPEAQQVG